MNTQWNGTSADYYKIKEFCSAKYGLKSRVVTDRTTSGIKKILKKGHVIAMGRPGYFYKPNRKKRYHSGHTVMFYKYANGYFYAKDSATDGGGMCPYPEAYAEDFFRGAMGPIVEYYR